MHFFEIKVCIKTTDLVYFGYYVLSFQDMKGSNDLKQVNHEES